MNIGQDKNIDEGLKCPPHLSEASTPTEAPTVFTHPQFGTVRTVEIDNEVWFVGKDVAEALGYSDPRSAISKKIENEDRGVAKMATPSGTQQMTIINESGLYSLILLQYIYG